MARNPEDHDLDVMAAAMEAQCRDYERTTGNPREVMWAQLPDALRPVIDDAQARFADMMRDGGHPGY